MQNMDIRNQLILPGFLTTLIALVKRMQASSDNMFTTPVRSNINSTQVHSMFTTRSCTNTQCKQLVNVNDQVCSACGWNTLGLTSARVLNFPEVKEENLFPCTVCNKTFSTSAFKSKHEFQVHGI